MRQASRWQLPCQRASRYSRLRRLLARSFTRQAVSRLEDRIRAHAPAICERVFTGREGECDFAKDVAADLPLLTLADVLGVPPQDRFVTATIGAAAGI